MNMSNRIVLTAMASLLLLLPTIAFAENNVITSPDAAQTLTRGVILGVWGRWTEGQTGNYYRVQLVTYAQPNGTQHDRGVINYWLGYTDDYYNGAWDTGVESQFQAVYTILTKLQRSQDMGDTWPDLVVAAQGDQTVAP
jgi:hypothetical protein